ncbi:MAG: glycosyltransferase family 2 protein [Planctomycetota bacterium]
MTDTKTAPMLSLAIPIYNESSVIDELLHRCFAALEPLPGGPHEVVVVDDGSQDDSLARLQDAATSHSELVVVSLSRNFGHQAAIGAALDHTKGDVVVVMDGDLQDPPEQIGSLLKKYHEGFDVVYAIRIKRKEAWWLRTAYASFYRTLFVLADLQLPEGAGDFALLSRRVVDWIRSSPERNRYLRGLRTWYGFAQTGIPLERDARHSGGPKYGLRRLFGLAFDAIFSFSIVPIRLATWTGVASVTLALAFVVYSFVAWLAYHDTSQASPTGFTALIFAITFLGGTQLLFLGIVGEYIGRIYDEVKRRPHYIVDSVTIDGQPRRVEYTRPYEHATASEPISKVDAQRGDR